MSLLSHPHPSGVSSFALSLQNVWKMTTVVDKIACHLCTACLSAIISRTFIVYYEYYQLCHIWLMCFVTGKNTAKPTENKQLYLQQLANMMFQELHCTEEHCASKSESYRGTYVSLSLISITKYNQDVLYSGYFSQGKLFFRTMIHYIMGILVA